ncbi:MAG: type II toxin-antitoxin system YafQ family toxin [Microvirga sp.]
MKKVSRTNRFRRDLKLIRKQGLDLRKLDVIVERRRNRVDLDERHHLHRLSGKWVGAWECHVTPDWLLIWYETEDELILARTGSHSELFE